MKGFEVGKRVRAKFDFYGVGGDVKITKGAILIIDELKNCKCGRLLISWGYACYASQCNFCNKIYKGVWFVDHCCFDPLDDDEIEIQSDTFKQVTFTKIIENVPAGVN